MKKLLILLIIVVLTSCTGKINSINVEIELNDGAIKKFEKCSIATREGLSYPHVKIKSEDGVYRIYCKNIKKITIIKVDK